MSKLYKPTTHEAYKIATGVLQYHLDKGIVQKMLELEGKSPEEIEIIIKAYKRIIVSMAVKMQ